MKKVLLVIHTPPPYGGGEIQAQHMKDYFIKKPGYIIYDYSRKYHSRADWAKVSFKVVCHGFLWILRVSLLIVWHRPGKIYFTLPKSYFGFLRNMIVLPLAHLFSTKVCGELPGTSFLFLENERSVRFKTGLFFLRKIDEIRFLSSSIALMHKKYNIKCARVISNGVELPKDISVTEDVFLKTPLPLIYIGALESSKGVFNSLAAVKICKDSGIPVHFDIIGKWTYDFEEARALEYIMINKLHDMITFHGVITGNRKWDILTSCAILIHPTYWDGVPLTILEAMGAGIPVISTRIGGIPDTVINKINGIILDKNIPEELANGIIGYFNNRRLLVEISKANKAEFHEKYRLEIFLRNMELWFNS